MIHPAGLGGRPDDGQRSSAAMNASWTASSATSRSPKTRARTATARPCSARKTRPIAAGETSVVTLERPDLDREGGRPGHLAAPVQGGVQVGGQDHGEPAKVLLALGERP